MRRIARSLRRDGGRAAPVRPVCPSQQQQQQVSPWRACSRPPLAPGIAYKPAVELRCRRCTTSQVLAASALDASLALRGPPGETQLATPSVGTRYRFLVPEYVTSYGQRLHVVGSLPELGSWAPHLAPSMVWGEGHQWSLELALPSQTFEFKIVAVEGPHVRWEGGSNRVVLSEDGEDLPVEIVVWLTCHFDAAFSSSSTQLQLALPRERLQDAYETSKATLEFLARRRTKLGQEAGQAPSMLERQRQAAELFKLSEAVAEQSTNVDELGAMLGHEPPAAAARGRKVWPGRRAADAKDDGGAAAPEAPAPVAAQGSNTEDDTLLLLAIDSVRLPRVLRRISFANVVQAWSEGPPALSAGAAASGVLLPASAAVAADGDHGDAAPAPPVPVSPFLRGELDARAEDLMSAAGALLEEMRATDTPDELARSSLVSLAEEAGHVAVALASLGEPSPLAAATQRQLEGLACVGSAMAAAAAAEQVVLAAEDAPAVAAAVEAAGAGARTAAESLVLAGIGAPRLAASSETSMEANPWQRATSGIQGQLAGLGAAATMLLTAMRAAAGMR